MVGSALRELWGRSGDLLRSPPLRAARRRRRQVAHAQRLTATLGELKGAYAKLGQFASLRADLLPAEVRAELASLQDRVAPRPLCEVASVIEAELGRPLGEAFAELEPRALAAASVAQVHRGRLPDGSVVAVKVQFPELAEALGADLRLTRWLLGRLLRATPAKIRERLFQEFARGLREELDFRHEARAAEEIARNLAGQDRVVVPRIHHSHSGRRVLTMDYVPGVRIDRDALARRGIPPRAVLEVLAHAYAKQVFLDGCFHADPHPGNVLVVDEPRAREEPRVLFVDFGLSRRLPEALRRELRRGMLALIQSDAEGLLAAMRRAGLMAPGAEPAVRDALAHMLQRIRGEGPALALGGAAVLRLKNEARQWLERTPGLELPGELLLYAKTLSYLFALGAELDPEVDLMRLSLPYVLRFLAEREPELTPRAGAAVPPGCE